MPAGLADVFRLVRGGDNLQVFVNNTIGTPTLSRPLADITSITIDALTGG